MLGWRGVSLSYRALHTTTRLSPSPLLRPTSLTSPLSSSLSSPLLSTSPLHSLPPPSPLSKRFFLTSFPPQNQEENGEGGEKKSEKERYREHMKNQDSFHIEQEKDRISRILMKKAAPVSSGPTVEVQRPVRQYLNQFLKKVHPDFFAHHPEVREKNLASLQKLNNLLDAVETILGDNMEQKKKIRLPFSIRLSFYKKEDILASTQLTKKKGEEEGEEESEIPIPVEHTIRPPKLIVKEAQNGSPTDPRGTKGIRKLNIFMYKQVAELIRKAGLDPPPSLLRLANTPIQTNEREEDDRHFAFTKKKNGRTHRETIAKVVRRRAIREGVLGTEPDLETVQDVKKMSTREILGVKKFDQARSDGLSLRQMARLREKEKKKRAREIKKREFMNPTFPSYLDPSEITVSHRLGKEYQIRAIRNLLKKAPKMYEVLEYGEWLDIPIFLTHTTQQETVAGVGLEIGRTVEEGDGGMKEEKEEKEEKDEDEKEKEKEKRLMESVPNLARFKDTVYGMIVLPHDFTPDYFKQYLKENLKRIRRERELIREELAEVIDASLEISKRTRWHNIRFQVGVQETAEAISRLNKAGDFLHLFYLEGVTAVIGEPWVPKDHFTKLGIPEELISPIPTDPLPLMCDDPLHEEKRPGPGSVFELEGYGSILSGQYFENRDAWDSWIDQKNRWKEVKRQELEREINGEKTEEEKEKEKEAAKKKKEGGKRRMKVVKKAQKIEKIDEDELEKMFDGGYLVPPIRNLLFDELGKRIYIPHDIQFQELRNFLARKVQEYPDILSKEHAPSLFEGLTQIKEKVGCKTVNYGSSLIGDPAGQREVLETVLSHADSLNEMGASQFNLILDTLDHYNSTKKTLRISAKFNGGKRELREGVVEREEVGEERRKEVGEEEGDEEEEEEEKEYDGFWRREKKRENWMAREGEDSDEL